MRIRCYSIILISFGIIVLILLINCLRLHRDVDTKKGIILSYEMNMKSTMLFPIDSKDATILDSISNKSNEPVTVVIPEYVCNSCLNELSSYLTRFCDGKTFSFWLPERSGLSEELDKYALPGKTIVYRDIGLSETSRILMVKQSSNKWKNCYFRYEPGTERALFYFLSI